ncbi:hypothetical protein CMU94_17930 [Elizabethkingia anophelis]|nr:hypothetical protein [Elizabethkingia anophelis]
MEKRIETFKKKFPNITIESKDYHYIFDDVEAKGTLYYLKGLEGNKELILSFEKSTELTKLSKLLHKNIYVFKDFLAIKYENTIEILLTRVSSRTFFRRLNDKNENPELFNIGLNYNRNELNISIGYKKEETILPELSNFIRGGKRYARMPLIFKIDNFIKPSPEGIENDARNIINSVLFDLEYNYQIALETINIEGLVRRSMGRRRKQSDLPEEKIHLVYKKYIPELIQYFHIAEKVDFLPFKFICFYHIIEYFSDKSAYHLVSNEVKKILLKPDFHVKTDQYVNIAINLFKKENDKYTGDKIKVERVLRQYINREELKKAIIDLELLEYFSQDIILDCVKPLRLPAINFEQEGNFYSELTKRIYSLRCSIVHSNPDFDESKAVPFNPTPNNLEKLRIEMELIMEIARIIIIESKE